jgi:hypothetical protein
MACGWLELDLESALGPWVLAACSEVSAYAAISVRVIRVKEI